MKNKVHSEKKEKITLLFLVVSSFFIILLLSIVICLPFFNVNQIAAAENSPYAPAAPSGPTFGYVGIEYDYSISTTDPNASWMFDWGDGAFSDWVGLVGSEQYVTQSHNWSLAGIYQVRVQYRSPYYIDGIWSSSTEVNISNSTAEDFPTTPSKPSGKATWPVNVSSFYSTHSTDLAGDSIQYRFDWGDGIISKWTAFNASGSSATMSHAWTLTGTYSIRSMARDVYGLNSSWSNPLNIVIEQDSDGDGLSDTTETSLGSDSDDSTDVHALTIAARTHYIVMVTSSDILIFYNTTLESHSIVGSNDDGTYLIDDDLDSAWDYTYDPLSGVATPYDESEESSFGIPLLWIIIGSIVVAIILVLLFLIKTGRIYIYEEYVEEFE